MSAVNGSDVNVVNDENEKVDQLLDDPETVSHNDDNSMPSAQDESKSWIRILWLTNSPMWMIRFSCGPEKAVKKKYGGMLPKKPPLISKDHERAFFDSADWALGKQGGSKPKGPLEALRPKLQPTPHQQARSRRSVYASSDGEDGGNAAAEDPNNNE